MSVAISRVLIHRKYSRLHQGSLAHLELCSWLRTPQRCPRSFLWGSASRVLPPFANLGAAAPSEARCIFSSSKSKTSSSVVDVAITSVAISRDSSRVFILVIHHHRSSLASLAHLLHNFAFVNFTETQPQSWWVRPCKQVPAPFFHVACHRVD